MTEIRKRKKEVLIEGFQEEIFKENVIFLNTIKKDQKKSR